MCPEIKSDHSPKKETNSNWITWCRIGIKNLTHNITKTKWYKIQSRKWLLLLKIKNNTIKTYKNKKISKKTKMNKVSRINNNKWKKRYFFSNPRTNRKKVHRIKKYTITNSKVRSTLFTKMKTNPVVKVLSISFPRNNLMIRLSIVLIKNRTTCNKNSCNTNNRGSYSTRSFNSLLLHRDKMPCFNPTIRWSTIHLDIRNKHSTRINKWWLISLEALHRRLIHPKIPK